MVRHVTLSLTEIDSDRVEAKASEVGVDILAEYRTLSQTLRQKGWAEAAAVDAARDRGVRAVHHCVFQLYGAAATELDAIIAELSQIVEHPYRDTLDPPRLTAVTEAYPRAGNADEARLHDER
ncbi:hypothetical protein [Methylobacterium sp. J-067]|uniref:hypothetical protein n=1 Tax=Methylobacterium sp. J-067 TaxID=2836648 RepID=UPI001FBBF6CD|nr:hypothetical protein [Methylobacterium sp. J-067]MCJ2023439.1 hypothetical protein [Methylobacterium sp. J-067]